MWCLTWSPSSYSWSRPGSFAAAYPGASLEASESPAGAANQRGAGRRLIGTGPWGHRGATDRGDEKLTDGMDLEIAEILRKVTGC